jgi:hypothetical protein
MVILKVLVESETVNRCCSHLLSVHVCMSQKIAFYCADKYEFQYANLASSSKNRLRPSDISYISESDEFVEKFSDCDKSELSNTDESSDTDTHMLHLRDV